LTTSNFCDIRRVQSLESIGAPEDVSFHGYLPTLHIVAHPCLMNNVTFDDFLVEFQGQAYQGFDGIKQD
jgi:hypothetical protein